MRVFIFKTRDYVKGGNSRVDCVPLTPELISLLYSYTLLSDAYLVCLSAVFVYKIHFSDYI